jgi:serine/threonine protein kinase
LPSEKDFEFVQNETTLKVIKSLKINERKTLRSILNTEDANLIDLLEQIFQLNPEKRPTADQILTHPFVSKFRGRL